MNEKQLNQVTLGFPTQAFIKACQIGIELLQMELG